MRTLLWSHHIGVTNADMAGFATMSTQHYDRRFKSLFISGQLRGTVRIHNHLNTVKSDMHCFLGPFWYLHFKSQPNVWQEVEYQLQSVVLIYGNVAPTQRSILFAAQTLLTNQNSKRKSNFPLLFLCPIFFKAGVNERAEMTVWIAPRGELTPHKWLHIIRRKCWGRAGSDMEALAMSCCLGHPSVASEPFLLLALCLQHQQIRHERLLLTVLAGWLKMYEESSEMDE